MKYGFDLDKRLWFFRNYIQLLLLNYYFTIDTNVNSNDIFLNYTKINIIRAVSLNLLL